MKPKLTCHSEFGKLKSTFIKRPETAFIHQDLINHQWENLNYLAAPNLEKAIIEFDNLEHFLKSKNIELSYFTENQNVTMDSIYCRDASIATDYGIILCNMGKKQRKPEPQAAREDYEKHGLKILGEISEPGFIEGGDVAWLGENTLAVAHSYRSNDDGFRQLTALLKKYGIETIQVDLPHYKGKNDVFHLMSIFSPVRKDLAVIYSPLMPVRFRNQLIERGYQFVEVPESEFESMGCNVLAIAPGKCIIVNGNPITKRKLEDAGCEVFSYAGAEISIKGGGGPTCLTRPLWREK